jgi:hypothetical protein
LHRTGDNRAVRLYFVAYRFRLRGHDKAEHTGRILVETLVSTSFYVIIPHFSHMLNGDTKQILAAFISAH